jgi:hypothetical protein
LRLAFACLFVPSTAITPTRANPDLAHSASRVAEHARDRILVALHEPGDRAVIRPLLRRDHRNVTPAASRSSGMVR